MPDSKKTVKATKRGGVLAVLMSTPESLQADSQTLALDMLS